MDRVSPKARSRIMSLVKSRHGRTTERRLRAQLVCRGIAGWKMNDPTLPGKPDFVFQQQKLVIFVDGCFWHGCSVCKRPPKSNVTFWLDKMEVNRRRDKRISSKLRRSGWSVFRIKECELKNPASTVAWLRRIHILVEAKPRKKN